MLLAPIAASAEDRIRVGIYSNPPKVFVNQDGQPDGFWPELTRVIAARRGWEIEWVHGTWSEGLRRLAEGRIDLMVDVGVTPERRTRFLFNEETVHVSWSRMYRRPEANIETIPDLAGKRIGGLESSYNLDGPDGLRELLENFSIDASVVTYPTYRAALSALDRDEVDAAVTNRDLGNRVEDEYDIERTPIVFQPAELRYAFPPGTTRSATLARAIDRQLTELKAERGSAYHTLLDRWLGPDSAPRRPIIDLPPWAQWTLTALTAVSIIAAVALLIMYARMRERRAELAQSTHMLSASQRMAAVGSWRLDARTRRLFWSEETYRIFGVSPDDYSPAPEIVLEHVHPDDRDRLVRTRETALEQGGDYDIEYRLRRPDDTERIVHSIAVAELNEQGGVIALDGTIQDVTERRLAEWRNQQYRQVLEASQDLFCIIDDQLRYRMMTAAYARAYGFDRDEAEGMPLVHAFDEDFVAREVRPRVEAAVRGEDLRFEAARDFTDSGRRHLLIHYFPVRGARRGNRMAGVSITDITAFKHAENELRSLNQHLADILESITDAFLTVDGDWRFQYVNTEAGRIMGRDPGELVGRNAWDEFPEGLGTAFEHAFTRAMAQRKPATVEEYFAPFDMWLYVRVYPTDEGLALYFQDVTERHRMLAQLREQEETLRESRDQLAGLLETRQSLINALPAHIALLDHDGTIVDINEQWRHFGWENEYPDSATGVGLNYLRICDAATGDCAEDASRARDGLRAILDGSRQQFVLEYPCHSPERERWFRLMANHIGGEVGAVVMHIDITERKQAELRLSRLAYEDPLTGLPSRNGVAHRVESTLDARGWSAAAVLVMLDVEGQRDINDVYGFAAGDRLLGEIGHRLTSELGDDTVVGRTGGDEFAVFLPAGDDEEATERRRATGESLERPFALDEGTVEIRARYGYTELGAQPRAVEALMREAELALFRNREDGRRWTAYTADLDAASQHRIEITRELRRALTNDEFQLHFQPKVDLASGEMVAGEALIRWLHPERGLQSPAAFIPVAEQSQLIAPIGDWALREACRLLAEWQADGLDLVRISVNVSVVQFTLGDLAATVADAIDAHGIDPGGLTLEITESVFERESDRLLDQLRRIHGLGVRRSLDDFGTGYSSLLYLQRYPFDEIKIDQGFVRHMLDDDYSHRIVTTVVNLAQALGAEVVPEGIEDAVVRDALRALGCRVGQGYHYSMPLATEDFRWLLEQRTTLPLATGTEGTA